jgi:hypothetical protein
MPIHDSTTATKPNSLLTFALCLALLLGCSSPRSKNDNTQTNSRYASGESLPVTASAYENVEPLATQRISTVPLTDRFARRTFKDPQQPDNWHELIIGTGNESEKVFAYFHFLPISTVEYAERDEREFRWGLLFGKYGFLANIPLTSLKDDLDLARECKGSAAFFYAGLHNPRGSEGVDIRGIHLSVKPYKKKTAVIIGVTSDQWNDIRRRIMRGEKHELYSFFPRTQ